MSENLTGICMLLIFFLSLGFSIVYFLAFFYIKKQQIFSFSFCFFFIFFLIGFFVLLFLCLDFSYGRFLIYHIYALYIKREVKKELIEALIVREPQELLSILVDVGFCFVLLFFFIFLCFYLNLYISTILRKDEFFYYSFIFWFVLYFFILSLFLFMFDLLFFHTDVFSAEHFFKFEPDILEWFDFYQSEYIDLLFAFLFIFFLYLVKIVNMYSLIVENVPIFRFISFTFFLTIFFYFIGGESFFRDFSLCTIAFILNEVLNYTLYLFAFFKRFK